MRNVLDGLIEHGLAEHRLVARSACDVDQSAAGAAIAEPVRSRLTRPRPFGVMEAPQSSRDVERREPPRQPVAYERSEPPLGLVVAVAR